MVFMKAGDENHLYGVGTNFTAQLHIRDSVRLPKSLDFAMTEVSEVVSNECITLKSPFTGDAAEALLAAGERLEDDSKASAFEPKPKTGIEAKGIEYKCLPYVDQTRVSACDPSDVKTTANMLNTRCTLTSTRSSRRVDA